MKTRTVKKYIVASWIFIILLMLDQFTKLAARQVLASGKVISVLDGIFELLYIENRGAAFGMLQGQFFWFYCATAIVGAVILYTLIKMPPERHYVLLGTSLVLIFSGAVGNCIDRAVLGFVTDFFYFKLIDFPVFNVADCYVTIGCALFIFALGFFYKDEDLEFIKKK